MMNISSLKRTTLPTETSNQAIGNGRRKIWAVRSSSEMARSISAEGQSYVRSVSTTSLPVIFVNFELEASPSQNVAKPARKLKSSLSLQSAQSEMSRLSGSEQIKEQLIYLKTDLYLSGKKIEKYINLLLHKEAQTKARERELLTGGPLGTPIQKYMDLKYVNLQAECQECRSKLEDAYVVRDRLMYQISSLESQAKILVKNKKTSTDLSIAVNLQSVSEREGSQSVANSSGTLSTLSSLSSFDDVELESASGRSWLNPFSSKKSKPDTNTISSKTPSYNAAISTDSSLSEMPSVKALSALDKRKVDHIREQILSYEKLIQQYKGIIENKEKSILMQENGIEKANPSIDKVSYNKARHAMKLSIQEYQELINATEARLSILVDRLLSLESVSKAQQSKREEIKAKKQENKTKIEQVSKDIVLCEQRIDAYKMMTTQQLEYLYDVKQQIGVLQEDSPLLENLNKQQMQLILTANRYYELRVDTEKQKITLLEELEYLQREKQELK